MKAQTLFLNEMTFETQAEGENLILPLLLTTLTFGVFLMSSLTPDKFNPLLETQKIESSSEALSQRNIVDFIWSCSPQSILEKGENCGR